MYLSVYFVVYSFLSFINSSLYSIFISRENQKKNTHTTIKFLFSVFTLHHLSKPNSLFFIIEDSSANMSAIHLMRHITKTCLLLVTGTT